jgi:predicted nucleotide-binding protein (sugar kinase/HSP70/actin superfamily)
LRPSEWRAYFFFECRKGIVQQFASLFNATDADEDEGSIATPSGLSKWGWYNVLETIAERDITKFKNILDLPVKEVLVHMAYIRDYNSEQKQLLKRSYKNV